MDLTALLRPGSLAVVGASPRTFVGRAALENCTALGFTGRLVAVNGRYPEVAGIPASTSIAQLDAPPDVALIQLGTDRVLGAVHEAMASGVRRFVIPGGGFTESGAAATRLRVELARLAAEQGIVVAGPNCMGVVDLVTGCAPYVGTVPAQVRRGNVAVLAQSGAVVEAFVNAGGRVPLSTAVSTGSEATTSLADYLRWFASDPETTAVCGYVERVDDGVDLLASIRELVAAGKSFAACVAGESETAQRGVQAHSGALAPAARVHRAALRQAGALVADDLDELLTFGELLGTPHRPRGRRAHLVTNSGGEGVLLADIAHEVGIDLPPMGDSARAALKEHWPRLHVGNPLDPWGVDDYREVYPRALAAAAAEPGDMLIVSQDQQASAGEHERQLGRDLARYLLEATAGHDVMPVLLSPTSQDPDPDLATFCRTAGIPLLRGARPAMSALAKLGAVAQTVVPDAAVAGPAPRQHPRLQRSDPLTEDEALSVLADHGVDVPHQATVRTVDAAVTAAESLGGPVVLKAVAPGLLHKSELGLVRVGLYDSDDVRMAGKEILDAAAVAGYDPRVLVMEMVTGELDVLVGFARDRHFGPTLLLGLGGVWTEMLDTVDLFVGTLDAATAPIFVRDTKVGRLLARARGGDLSIDGIVTTLCALSELASAHPEITAIDVNPLIVGRGRSVAVDAVIQHSNESQQEGTHV